MRGQFCSAGHGDVHDAYARTHPGEINLATTGAAVAIANKLSAEFAKASKAPDVIQKLESQGAVPVGSTAEQFMQTIVTEVTRWRKVVQENNLKIEG